MPHFDSKSVKAPTEYPHVDMKMRRVAVNQQLLSDGTTVDVEVQYNLQGREDGPVIVWIMGLGGQSINYHYETFIRPFLLAGYRVLRFDNRDSGLSTNFCGRLPSPNPVPRRLVQMTNSSMDFVMSGFGFFEKSLWPGISEPSVAYCLEDMAQDLKNLMDILKIEKAHIAGVSMGGMLAQVFSLNYPDRVLSLTSVMSNTNDKASHLQPSLIYLASLFVSRSPPKYPADSKYETLSQSVIEWAEFLTGGNTLMGAGPTGTHDGGLPFFDVAIRGVRRAMNSEVPNKDGVLRQMAAIESTTSRTKKLYEAAPTLKTLIVHGSIDQLVPTTNGHHCYATMANSIHAFNVETSGDRHPKKKPVDEFDIKFATEDAKSKFASVEASNGNYVRYLLINGGTHDLNDEYALTLLPTLFQHLADVNKSLNIENPYCIVNNPWKIPAEMDMNEPGCWVPGIGTRGDFDMNEKCQQIITRVMSGEKFDDFYFPPRVEGELPHLIKKNKDMFAAAKPTDETTLFTTI